MPAPPCWAPPAPVPSESPRLGHARQGSPKYVLHTVEEGKVHGKAEEPPAAAEATTAAPTATASAGEVIGCLCKCARGGQKKIISQ